MELASRGNLYSLLHVNPSLEFTRLLQLRVARQVAYSVAYLESIKLLHRDIKSLNYLVTENWECKLSDFGTAKLLPENAQHTLVHTKSIGSPLWMAPEVRASEKYGLDADVYSLGVVLYELFEQKLPAFDMQQSRIVWPAAAFPSSHLVVPLVLDDPKTRAKAFDAALYIDHLLAFVTKDENNNVQARCVEFMAKTQLKDIAQLQAQSNSRALEEMLRAAAVELRK
jgi:serine/threonine protein kinase